MSLAVSNRGRLTKSTIVVVDDDDDVREMVCTTLNNEGYCTIGSSNGRETLDLLEASSERPLLIILDLTMPVMDGWEFLLKIDDDPELHKIPVALMSAHPSILRAFDADREEHGFARLLLPKPLNMPRLLSIVRGVCHPSGTFRKPF
jgi:CheY-like chemotaxis protein